MPAETVMFWINPKVYCKVALTAELSEDCLIQWAEEVDTVSTGLIRW